MLAIGLFSLSSQAALNLEPTCLMPLDSEDTCDVIIAPAGLGATVSSAGVIFFWDFIPNALVCQVRVKRIGQPGIITLPLVFGPPPPTSLFWDADSIPIDSGKIGFVVRCWCDTNTVSLWSETDTVCLDSLFLRPGVGATGIMAYPNPVGSNLELSWLNAEDGFAVVHVYDVRGRLTSEQSVPSRQGRMTFDTSSWARGMYVVEYTIDGTPNRIRVLKH